MRLVLRSFAVISLSVLLVAPLLYWTGVIAETTNKQILLVASIGWFVFALSSRR